MLLAPRDRFEPSCGKPRPANPFKLFAKKRSAISSAFGLKDCAAMSGSTDIDQLHGLHKASLARANESKIPASYLIVDLSTTPLLRDGLVLIQDVGGHVVEVLLLHGAHLWPDVATLDGRVNF